jgi:hypothetical protein
MLRRKSRYVSFSLNFNLSDQSFWGVGWESVRSPIYRYVTWGDIDIDFYCLTDGGLYKRNGPPVEYMGISPDWSIGTIFSRPA